MMNKGEETTTTRRARLLIDFIGKQPQAVVIGAGSLLVIALGIVDYETGPDVSFLLFYLLPVFLVTWFAGSAAGILMSIASAVFWFVDDVIGRAPKMDPAVPYWNAAAKLGVFLALTVTLRALKDALERVKLAEEQRLRHDLEIARQVQERLFPQALPPMKTLDYTGICKPAFSVGGDYFDFLQLSTDRLGVAVGDVSGKGISSALLMASLQGMLRSRALQRGMSVAELMKDLNEMMRSLTDTNKFVTFFYGLYDDSTRTLTYVNAGHNPPLLFRRNEQDTHPCEIVPLTTGGIVLGLVPRAKYHQAAVELKPGDVLVMFTDGISEARNAQEQEFGEDRLANLIAANLHLAASALQDLILARVQEFVGTMPQHDDMTLSILKVL